MKEELNKRERLELVELLRKNLLYQTPRPVFTSVADVEPSHVELRLVYGHQRRILELIHKAGGWVLGEQEKLEIIAKHEQKARRAHGDGNDYDLSEMSYGDLVAIYEELDGVDEMAPFREAIKEELRNWKKETTG